MCSHYQVKTRLRQLAGRFRFLVGPEMADEPVEDVRPTDRAPLVLGGGRLVFAAWGLASAWDRRPIINARAESLTDRPTFRPLLTAGRCLVPADVYFEWRHAGRAKFRNTVVRPDGGPFAFAGLTDGARFTLVTCAAGPDVAAVKDRMPVVLEETAEEAWIDPAAPFEAVAALLAPPARGRLAAVEDVPPPPRQASLF